PARLAYKGSLMSSRLLLLALAASLGTLASTTAALAQEEEDPEPEVSTQADPEPEVSSEAARPSPWDRFLAVSATVGLDTPLGIGGAAIEVTPFPYLAIYAGGGVG